MWYVTQAFWIIHWRSKRLRKFIWNTAWYIVQYLFGKLLWRRYSVLCSEEELGSGCWRSSGAAWGPARFPRSQPIPSLLTRTCKAGLCVLWCWCNLPATRLTLFVFWWDLHSLTSFLSPITSFFLHKSLCQCLLQLYAPHQFVISIHTVLFIV